MGRKRKWLNDAERKQITRRDNTIIVAFDGEGYDIESGHKYTLLVASNGIDIDYVHNDNRLTTLQCLDFILRMKRKYPQSIFISFAFQYDITHILYDLSREELQALKQGACVVYHGYKIRLRYGKRLWVAQGGVSAQINDIFGFCQTSLIKSLRNWQINVDVFDYTEIVTGKERRGAKFELERELRYTSLELKYTIELFRKIRDSVKNAIETPLVAYNGAGSIAATLLGKHIAKHKREQWQAYHYDNKARNYVLGAYYGGRIEQIKFGYCSSVIHNYDINSAYPAVIRDMHSLDRYKFVSGGKAYEFLARNKPEIGIAMVKWSFPENVLYPFPYRFNGRVYFPREGYGFVHLAELYAAMEVYGTAIRRYVDIEELLVYWGNERPFEWIEHYYEKRRELKAQGKTGEQLALKLGLNSLYGKMAQRFDEGDEGIPICVNMVYAGHITSVTRATLYKLAMQRPYEIISINTDGIYATSQIKATVGTMLGEYEYTQYKSGLFVYSGLYFLWKGNGDSEIEAKTRGIDLRRINTPDLIDRILVGYKTGNIAISIPQRRFIGYRYATISEDYYALRGTFVNVEREIRLYPNEKRTPIDIDISTASRQLLQTQAVSYDYFYDTITDLPRNEEYEYFLADAEDNVE